MELSAFEGDWTLTRRIKDARAGATGHFEGEARFQAAPGGLSYLEEGRLTFGAAAPMAATRRYFWRAAGTAIEVDFADGRFFHAFQTDVDRPEAAHHCAPDKYAVRYDFSAWPAWRAEWRVAGPRKDYAMISDYRRAGQLSGIAR
jgi:hypothetical protein